MHGSALLPRGESGFSRVREAFRLANAMAVLRPSLMLAALVLNLLGLALPLAMLQIFDRIIPHAAFGTLGLIVMGLAAAIVAEATLRLARDAIVAWEGARFEHATATRLLERVLQAPTLAVERTAIGAHLDQLNSVEPVRDFYGQQASMLLVDLPFLAIFLGLIAYIGGWLVLAPLVLIGVFGVLAWIVGRALHDAHRARKDIDDRRYNFIVEILSSIHTAKGLAMERVLQRRHERLISGSSALGWRVNYLSSIAESFGPSFSQTSTVAVGGLGALMVIDGVMSTGALAASTMLAGRAVQPLLRSLALWTRYQTVSLSLSRMGSVEALPREPRDAAAPAPVITSLAARDVTFGYQEDAPLFRDLSVDVNHGETIGISGINGSGKSTLLWMLMGGIAPTAGKITVNGEDMAAMSRESLRQQIAYIPQKAMLFRGNVLQNLTNFDLHANLEPALDLAAALGLDRYFAAVPDGYDMDVGNSVNGGLPSGVVQRIAMVRALVRQPRVILFDEANAALDQAGDVLVRDLLMHYRKRAAIVIVSFRPSLLSIADRQFLLRDRRLIAASPSRGSRRGNAA